LSYTSLPVNHTFWTALSWPANALATGVFLEWILLLTYSRWYYSHGPTALVIEGRSEYPVADRSRVESTLARDGFSARTVSSDIVLIRSSSSIIGIGAGVAYPWSPRMLLRYSDDPAMPRARLEVRVAVCWIVCVVLFGLCAGVLALAAAAGGSLAGMMILAAVCVFFSWLVPRLLLASARSGGHAVWRAAVGETSPGATPGPGRDQE
jgi:hypothetical protein